MLLITYLTGHRPVRVYCLRRLDQIPLIAIQIDEDSHHAVAFGPRRLNEPDTTLHHFGVIAPEIIGLEEEENSASGLIANPCRLFGGSGLRQQE